MCGIGAILRVGGEPIPDAWLDVLDERIAYRGPDGCGRFRDRVKIDSDGGRRTIEVALVHRRLSIIDHQGGGQPMVRARGRTADEGLVAVVFNGCIYNHRELRRELEAAGHRFESDHSDVEVLLHGHREWGDRLQDRLEGMYAYALWDRNAGALSLGRDWFGEKPLYHRFQESGGSRLLVAASDASAVASVAGGPAAREELRDWVRNYLRFGCAWRGRAVAGPGVRVDNVEPSAPGVDPHEADLSADRIELLLDQAVARRLEADVPLGCFLSGGTDSSLIACFARRHLPDLRTFCVRMNDPRYDESAHAEAVAAHLGTDHATLEAEASPAEDLIRLIGLLGQPFGDSSILPTYWVSKAARRHVKVALTGDGGDELFLGYERYLAARLLSRYGALRWIPPQLLRGTHARSLPHKIGRLGEMARDFPSLGVLATESVFTEGQIAALLDEPSPQPPPAGELPDPAADSLSALRDADLKGYLPDDLLCKVDTASMAVALEVRSPFLDRDLARAVLAMPADHLIPGGRRKELLRRIARRHLPASAVDRPKMGFAVPIGQWFRTDFGGLRALLLDNLHAVDPFGSVHLRRHEVRRLLDEHMSGRRDHGQRLFALLTLSLWARGR